MSPYEDTAIKKRTVELDGEGYGKSRKQPKPVQRNTGNAKKLIFRSFLVLFTLLFLIIGGLLGAIMIIEFGPSEKARDLFVVSMMETSAAQFLATSFLGQEKVDEIMAANAIQITDEITDTELVVVGGKKDGGVGVDGGDKTNDTSAEKNIIPGSDGQEVDPDGDGIDIVEVIGSTYRGKMMIVYDPTRVFVGISGEFGEDKYGKTIDEIYGSYDNVAAGINGGGWDDRPGHGTGGEPYGIVMSQGEVLWGGALSTSWECCAITNEGKLIVGTFSIHKAIEMGVTDAAKYGPTLIVNDVPTESLGTGGGLNPRTAIGQRADGAMLLLVIDGRQSNSLGASLVDVQDVMLKFGAVNAYNLDGGSSTSMLYHGEHINSNASLIGLRKMCTAFLVRE
ncbi:MAG: phosphodiester glycosidase family protein [Ruminococcaceae bacterium]|nr:phosphodiester glycosidase family protein [Oscillospiraceae bacterium]